MFRGILNMLTRIVGDKAAIQANKIITRALAKIKLRIDMPEESDIKYAQYSRIINKVNKLSENKS